MEHKHAIVVDAQGYKQEFVLVQITDDGQEQPYSYDLQEGESLVYDDVSGANSMYRPRWSGSVWEEAATQEEIDAEEQRRQDELGLPDTQVPQIDPRDLALAELAEVVVTNQLQTDMALAEIFEMIVGG